jgi:hypothetical protein
MLWSVGVNEFDEPVHALEQLSLDALFLRLPLWQPGWIFLGDLLKHAELLVFAVPPSPGLVAIKSVFAKQLCEGGESAGKAAQLALRTWVGSRVSPCHSRLKAMARWRISFHDSGMGGG